MSGSVRTTLFGKFYLCTILFIVTKEHDFLYKSAVPDILIVQIKQECGRSVFDVTITNDMCAGCISRHCDFISRLSQVTDFFGATKLGNRRFI